jgi:lysophospholipase L1-like esterase
MSRDRLRALIFAAMGAASGLWAATADAQTALVDDPCAGVVSGRIPDAALRASMAPGAKFVPPPPEAAAESARRAAEQRARDWPNLCRYSKDNAALKQAPRVVFMGDSITEGWAVADPEMFAGEFADRGISGQTSPQMLLRFRADVVALKPRIVHIMAGTNDLAGNTGPTSDAAFKGAIESMTEIAKANGVQVALASIPPAGAFPWAAQYKPAPEIRRLNSWLRDYARRKGLIYVNYHDALTTTDGAFRPELSNDGVHPNLAGYAVMKTIALQALGRP